MSVERQTKEKFPKQRRLCEQRLSTVASIRSCPARLKVCGTCGVYGLHCSLGVACVRSCRARLRVCGTCEGKLYMRTQKRDWDKTQPLNFFAFILLVLLRLHSQRILVHLLRRQALQPLRQLRQREQQLFPHPQQIAVLIAAFLLR